MRILLGIGTACLAGALASPAAFGQATPPRARSAQSEQMGETAYLGVSAVDMTSDRAKTLKLKEERGVEVTQVTPDSAASKAGVKEGDVILDFNGQKVESWEQLVRLVHETPIHREVKLNLWRNGAEQTVTAIMGSKKNFEMEMGGGFPMAQPNWVTPTPPPAPMPPQMDLPMFRTLIGTSSLGIVGESLGQESQLAEFFGVKDGVLVRSVNRDSAADKAGMKAGDVITKIEDRSITSPSQIAGALRGARNKSSVNVTVIRNKKETVLTVTPDANGMFRGGLWDPKENILLDLFQPTRPQKL